MASKKGKFGDGVTNKLKREYVRHKLKTDPKWALKALVVLHDAQTAEEKALYATTAHNNVGFNSCDAEFLSSYADQYKARGRLSDTQMRCLHRCIVKYWQQIVDRIEATNYQKLVEMMKKEGFLDEQTTLKL